MFGRKKKKKDVLVDVTEVVKLKPLNYPSKILVGWAEAISGNIELRDWFLSSDQYKELGMCIHALLLKDDARVQFWEAKFQTVFRALEQESEEESRDAGGLSIVSEGITSGGTNYVP